jgi:hypothetical protein
MIVKDFKKIDTTNPKILAYHTSIKIFELKDIIYPHEETLKGNPVTSTINNTFPIVLGVVFEKIGEELAIKDELYILDGHHRFQYIVDNSISKNFDVILANIESVKMDSYNTELLIEKEIFLKEISEEYGFSSEISLSSSYIQVDGVNYFSNNFSDIKKLYSYKKYLMNKKMISPIPNNHKNSSIIVKFPPLSFKDFSKNYVFPYKSTWITPRFDK